MKNLLQKINNANKMCELIRKTFINLDKEIFKALYTALVRPYLEYASQVLNRYLSKDIEAVENVQWSYKISFPA